MSVLVAPQPDVGASGPAEPAAAVRLGGLDGLRAVAVAAVVLFHLTSGVLPGGYLGVDLFMVLSGYLITGILLDERSRTGSVRLARFWARRFRRLVPALVALLAVVAVWVDRGFRDLAPTVRGQGLAALGYVANWKLVADGVSYAALQDPPSPLLHLWSLAVEEQFYVLWPPLVVLVLARARGRRDLLVLAALGAAASAVAMAWWFDPATDPLRLYYGTDTRAHTFLVGALTAVLVRRHPGAVAAPATRYLGAGALLAVVVAFRLGSEGAWTYRGGFLAFALVAAIAVVAATVPGPVRWLLDRPGLRVVGRTSYGIYLWHWPVIVLLREEDLGFGGARLLAVRLAALVAATTISWRLVERPAATAGRRALVLAGAAGVLVAAGALLALPSTSRVPYADVDVDAVPPVSVAPAAPTAPATQATPPSGTPSSGTPGSATAPPPATPPGTLLIVGDSGTYDAVPGIVAGFTTGGWDVVSAAYPGVGVTRPSGVLDRWSEAVGTHDPDVVLVLLGGWDDQFIREQGGDAYRAALDETVSLLGRDGARILWLTPLPGGMVLEGDPDRYFAELPDRHPGIVEHLDLTTVFAGPDGDFPVVVDGLRLRKPDGWHLCPDGAVVLTVALLEHLGVTSEGWSDGAWRADERYDDPPGGCAG
jgi:peptidoglycan/LPS O-acetylase OafA/YrhL